MSKCPIPLIVDYILLVYDLVTGDAILTEGRELSALYQYLCFHSQGDGEFSYVQKSLKLASQF